MSMIDLSTLVLSIDFQPHKKQKKTEKKGPREKGRKRKGEKRERIKKKQGKVLVYFCTSVL